MDEPHSTSERDRLEAILARATAVASSRVPTVGMPRTRHDRRLFAIGLCLLACSALGVALSILTAPPAPTGPADGAPVVGVAPPSEPITPTTAI